MVVVAILRCIMLTNVIETDLYFHRLTESSNSKDQGGHAHLFFTSYLLVILPPQAIRRSAKTPLLLDAATAPAFKPTVESLRPDDWRGELSLPTRKDRLPAKDRLNNFTQEAV